MPENPFALKVGQLCNVVVNGQMLPNYELLHMDGNFYTFRADLRVSPQTEIVLIPLHQVERIGLVGVR